MAKARGGLSASPSSSMPRLAQSAVRGVTSPPAQDSTVPPSEGGTPSQRRYPTRRSPTDPVPPTTKAKRPASRPPAKRAKFSGPGEPSQTPQAEPPTKDSQIPVGIPLEAIIRRPMIAGPPIEATWIAEIDHSTQRPSSTLRLSNSSQSSGIHSICYRGITWSIFSPLGSSII
ncbi:pectinesterase inhibitor 10-like [Vitis riparia]|uniref:pectinesterase inhibitor 10-like n=1 Tax=Vitis riparia TaxID=96939 RepID=UPI00155B067D|nr:pectinesterase inhibitor 10-like [Vitis riparia]